MTRSRTRIVDPKQIAALASPRRMEIIDTLEALGGTADAATLARELGRPVDGLYYHLRALARVGLLEELDAGRRGRRWRSIAGRGRLALGYRTGRNANARAVARVHQGVLRLAARDFARAVGDAAVVAEGPERELWVARNQGWVTPAELREINRTLRRLGDLLGQRRDATRARRIALAWVLAPLPVRAVRRGTD
jgi:hypothetical protein